MKRSLVVMLLFASAGVQADDWGGPLVTEVFSQSREWFVRVVPGKMLGNSIDGVAGGTYAKAQVHHRERGRAYRLMGERPLVNPVAPVDFLVTDRGYLATLDNWASVGYGNIAAFYSPRGDLIRSVELKDLFSDEEIPGLTRTMSSIWWRSVSSLSNKGAVYVRPGQQSLSVALDDKGTQLIVETETGAWQFCQWRGPEHLCRTTNVNRSWKKYVEPKLRP